MSDSPWQGPTTSPSSGGSACNACNPRPAPHAVAINAFHIPADAQEEARVRRMTNRASVPADFAGVVALARTYRAQAPILQLSISCHGTLGTLYQLEDGSSRVEFVEPMGRIHVGTSDEILDASSLSRDPTRQLARELGECVEVGGRIVWQACFIGHPDGGDFLRAFSALAPHVEVLGSSIETFVGRENLAGPARSFDRSGTFRDVRSRDALMRDYSAEICRNGRCIRTSTSRYGRTLLR